MSSPRIEIKPENTEPDEGAEFSWETARPVFETCALDAGGREGDAVGRLRVLATRFDDQRSRESRRPTRSGDRDHYMLQLFTAGGVIGECDGAYSHVSVGDICFRDLARPFDCIGVPSTATSLRLPREALDRGLGAFDLHGHVLPAREPTTRLLAGFMVSLSAMAQEIGGLETTHVEAATVELIVSIYSRTGARRTVKAPAQGLGLRARVASFIDAHLDEPSLRPELLMRRFQLSRARLYRLFPEAGGVASAIRNRRLDAAFRELSGGTGRSITTLAHDLGFSSSSQFSRAFRARFNCSPRDVTGKATARFPAAR